MKENRLRNLENNLYSYSSYFAELSGKARKTISDLINSYRQLEKENNKLDEKFDEVTDQLCDAADEYFKMKEANAELLEALKPFALAGSGEMAPVDYIVVGRIRAGGKDMKITTGNLRNAHEAYDKHKGE